MACCFLFITNNEFSVVTTILIIMTMVITIILIIMTMVITIILITMTMVITIILITMTMVITIILNTIAMVITMNLNMVITVNIIRVVVATMVDRTAACSISTSGSVDNLPLMSGLAESSLQVNASWKLGVLAVAVLHEEDLRL